MRRKPHKTLSNRSNLPGERVFIDTCGPMQVESMGGNKYFLLAKDEATGYMFIKMMKQKNESTKKMEEMLNEVQATTPHTIKIIRSDNGTEFNNEKFKNMCLRRGIRQSGKLNKGLYGLCQSPLLWHEKLTKSLKSLGLIQLETDKCLFTQKGKNTSLLLVIYVTNSVYVTIIRRV